MPGIQASQIASCMEYSSARLRTMQRRWRMAISLILIDPGLKCRYTLRRPSIQPTNDPEPCNSGAGSSKTMHLLPMHNEAVEKPDSESFPTPDSCHFYRGHQLADSRDFDVQPSASAFWGSWRRHCWFPADTLPGLPPRITQPSARNSPASQYCAPGSIAATGPAPSSCPAN